MTNRISPIINDRINYIPRLDGADTAPPSDATSELIDNQTQPEMDETMEPALRIIRQRTRNKQVEFLVLFCDKSAYWCSEVTPELLRQFRLKQQEKRNRANRRNKQRTGK